MNMEFIVSRNSLLRALQHTRCAITKGELNIFKCFVFSFDEEERLMTVHASKGLEFPVVFIVGMDEDIFPCRQAFDTPRTMEEERRLFYVAMTRAKDRCFLTGSDQRFRNGSIQPLMRSSFIGDIDRQYLKIIRI